jgi:hypothetical protein
MGCLWIEACDQLPLLDRCEVLLAPDNNELMCPDGIGERLNIRV